MPGLMGCGPPYPSLGNGEDQWAAMMGAGGLDGPVVIPCATAAKSQCIWLHSKPLSVRYVRQAREGSPLLSLPSSPASEPSPAHIPDQMGGAFSTRPPLSGSSPRRDRHSPPRLPLPLHLLDCVALFSALHTARRTAAFLAY
ncbi:hypothetical protein AcV5_005491 [Taiwanofungus camphoratus]|nr:hypothetical protein AcV5_005491 [Antrodia cinnamomea]